MKTVLFDLDGTIVDSGIGVTTCTQYALRAFGGTYGFGTRKELEENGAVAVCDSVKEVEAYIRDEF